jgi:hypothetical protein
MPCWRVVDDRRSAVVVLLHALVVASALQLPPAVEQVLATGTFKGTPAGFQIIALSHVADGCAARVNDDAEGARVCVERALSRAQATKAKGLNLDDGRAGLWLSHLALILGAAHSTGPCLDEGLHRRVVEGLVKGSLADPTGHTSSFVGKRERWSADQAATLAAIARFDAGHGTHLLDEPLARYRAHLSTAVDVTTGLPWSEARGVGTGKMPRGCAVTFSVRYLGEVDRALATSWWTALKAHYLVDRAVAVGFREWPPGVDRPSDADSGPIVQGVGASATAFGIAAARAMDDDVLAGRLEATATLVGGAVARLGPSAARAAGSTLAAAIRFQAARQPSLIADAP